ncbi:MarR family winged helix-turn-helix transcriptional regulator [Streptomyces sp. NPDC001795]|uniref:MarR family winged helix-turn-helix transcriptional regulator n=1 Tax=Streptomyces sp. NPDC001795 TaxID=3154525 RepID=UPI00331D3E50
MESRVDPPPTRPARTSRRRSDRGAAPPPGALSSAARSGPLSHAVVRTTRLHRAVAGHLLRPSGLYPSQELLMMHLWENGPQPQLELVRLLGAEPSTVTRMVKRLEQGGFVRRSPSPTDGRAMTVEATTASQGLRRQVENAWQELEQTTFGGFTDAERETLAALLRKAEDNLTRALNAWA